MIKARSALLTSVVLLCSALPLSQTPAGAAEPNAATPAYFESQLKSLGNTPGYAALISVYKAWNAALPLDGTPKEKLVVLLSDIKQYDAAYTLSQPHFDAPDDRFSGQLMTALDLYFAGRDAEVLERTQRVIQDARKEHVGRFSANTSGWSSFRASSAMLGLAGALELEARVLLRQGKSRPALNTIKEGLDAAQEALDTVKLMPPNEVAAAASFQAKETYTNLLLLKIRGHTLSASPALALQVLEEYLPVIREVEAHPRYFWNLAVSHYNQRNFRQSETFFRRADAAAQAQGYNALGFFRADCRQGIVGSLEGQRKWTEAAAELDQLDQLAGADETLKNRVRYRFERSYAYLRTGTRPGETLQLLIELTKQAPDGLFAGHAMGLHGVALWRQQKDPAQAIALLKEAVDVYMKPIYFDDQTLGLNADVRDFVVETYLEAVFLTPGEDRLQALGPAEWIRGSTVQSALGDAAIRSVARDPKLLELVRRDQDLKHQIRNLRVKAAVEPDDVVSAQINDLNITRAEIQSKIKLTFPDYDNLVAPSPPSPSLALRKLAPDEVFVLLIPTEQSVFIWTLASDGSSASARATISRIELQALVRSLRRTLDFGEMGGQIAQFNAASAFALYRQLLAPVKASLEGKKHLIVAAGGVLGQIPFGVLVTEQPTTNNPNAQFLIKQFAVSHVPSLSAWMSVKQFAQSRAPQNLIAWGDPLFGQAGQGLTYSGTRVRQLALTRSQPQADENGPAASNRLRYSDIPTLPETRDELFAIANALQADPNVDLHLGARATRASVLESNANGELARKRVVVFATHGLMAGDLPKLSQPALALANTDETDQNPLLNLLLLEDVLSLRLNSDWVVLSACNTAAADGKVDEALSGLARGFFYAGSRSLLVTHWAVESESAKELTTNTLRNYVANPTQRKAESLRQAMLTVMAKPPYQHPAYWAPYALVGDGGR